MDKTQNLFKFDLNFFQVLSTISKKTPVYLNIPDTLIQGFGFNSASLITTDPVSGTLVIKKNLKAEAVEETFKYFSELETDPIFPISVFKTESSNDASHSKVLFSLSDCNQKWAECTSSGKAVQKFIRNKNTLGLIQSSWDNIESKLAAKEVKKHGNLKKAHELYKRAASTKKKQMSKDFRYKAQRDVYFVLEHDNCKSSVFTNPEIERKMVYLVQLFEKYFLKDANLKIISFDADWIEDSLGSLYLLNVKKYRIGQVKAVKHSIFLFPVPAVQVPVLKPRVSIDLKKKVKNNAKSHSKSCINFSKTVLSVSQS